MRISQLLTLALLSLLWITSRLMPYMQLYRFWGCWLKSKSWRNDSTSISTVYYKWLKASYSLPSMVSLMIFLMKLPFLSGRRHFIRWLCWKKFWISSMIYVLIGISRYAASLSNINVIYSFRVFIYLFILKEWEEGYSMNYRIVLDTSNYRMFVHGSW